jgi:endogenous inhibitor of DNA gyrase (YacG/DUF329 family)
MSGHSSGAGDAPQVKCPRCGRLCLYAVSNKWRPFCSEHCRSVDLGAWASERYRVAGSAETTHDPETSGDPS